MRRKLILFMAAAVLSFNLTACGDSESISSDGGEESRGTLSSVSETVSESAESEVESKAEIKSEVNEYDGTFNEEVFDKIVSNVVIGDKTLSFPCSLNDLGEGFSFWDEVMIYDEETELRSSTLLFEGKFLATVTMHCTPDDDDYSDNEIGSIGFTFLNEDLPKGINYLSIGSIELNDNKEKIIKYLGEPNEKVDMNNKKVQYKYEISERKHLEFLVNSKGLIKRISFTNY